MYHKPIGKVQNRFCINVFYTFSRTTRLGNKGVQEVQTHPFFKNEQWDFNNIRECPPPIVCELAGDDDTRNFDDVENDTPSEDFPTPKAFAGNHLPFVGFTYSKDYQLLSGGNAVDKPPPLPGRLQRSSMSNHVSSDGLNDQLTREREANDDLRNRLTKSMNELTEANSRENELRSAISQKDKEIALAKHELKESQRRCEQEQDSRRKADSERSEMRKKLEDETNRRTKEQNNHHVVSEKIANLEKEKRDLADRMKKESELLEKYKKSNTELSVQKASAESSYSDMTEKMKALSEDRNLLETQFIQLQSHLQQEQNQRNEVIGHLKELENRLETQNRDLLSVQDREQRLLRENADLSSQKAEIEKTKANLELEARRLNNQLMSNQPTLRSSSSGVTNRDVTDDLNNRTEQVKGLEAKLSDEKAQRLRAEASIQDKERELSMVAVDVRQLQYKLDKMDAELRQESDKCRGALASVERLKEEKSLLQSEMSCQAADVTLIKTSEKRLQRDLSDYRERTKSLEEELHKVKAARSVDDLQRKELEEQLEAEQYFTTLYKTQVRELTDEVDEAKEKTQELENEKKSLIEQMKIIASQAETEAMERRVIEQDLTDLEREKMMLELELKDSQSKNKVALRNLDMQAQTSKVIYFCSCFPIFSLLHFFFLQDTEADLLQRLDMLSKENEELSRSLEVKLQEKENKPANDDNQLEMEKLKKSLQTEKMLKQQAVNKLAEIMNRKVNNCRILECNFLIIVILGHNESQRQEGRKQSLICRAA